MKVSKKIIGITLWSLSAVVLVVLLGFSNHEQGEQLCKGLKIKIADQTGNYFIEPQDIIEILNSKGNNIKSTPMKEVDLTLLERIIYTNPFVAKAEVYATIDGFVNIDIWQRNPVLRVINVDNEHFYVDDMGEYMPVTDKFTSHVVVASGYIYDKPVHKTLPKDPALTEQDSEKSMILQLNEVAKFLRLNSFWDAQIEQLYVNDKLEIEIIPRVGNQRIILGTSNDLDLKMKNLFIFYTEGLTKVGWDKYSIINLKYLNQVICTKSKSQIKS